VAVRFALLKSIQEQSTRAGSSSHCLKFRTSDIIAAQSDKRKQTLKPAPRMLRTVQVMLTPRIHIRVREESNAKRLC
jgi:hypothetical protein